MACFSPLVAYQTDHGEIVFVERGKIRRELKLPCGRCVGCLKERARQWAVRCVHENQMHEASSFVTLTFNDENLPADYSLDHKYYQLFQKRLVDYRYRSNLRSGMPRALARRLSSVRYYMCGEYGTTTSRPHYHSILFGVHFEDMKYLKKSDSGESLYKSEILDSLWSNGDCYIGSVTFQSAAYIAGYVFEKHRNAGKEWILDPETGELTERKPEYTRMSLKPGIGATWYEKYNKEVYPLDRVVIDGREQKPPRYYDNLLSDSCNLIEDEVKFNRYLKAIALIGDSTPDRLRTKEICANAKLKLKQRS